MMNNMDKTGVNMSHDFIFGDSLDTIDELVNNGIVVDFVLTDPPFGVTACKWDSIIPFNRYIDVTIKNKTIRMYKDEYLLHCFKLGVNYNSSLDYFEKNSKSGLWDKLQKITNPSSAIAIFGSEPFSTMLKMSNFKNYKYDWKWVKNQATNHLHAKRMPLRKTENVSIFYAKQPTYNPQRTSGHVPTNSAKGCSDGVIYHGTNKRDYVGGDTTRTANDLLNFNSVDNYSRVHPSQKPVELLEYFISTYTNEGDTVLDFTCGFGSTAKACDKLGRNSISIDNGFCDKKKIINGISIDGVSWTELSSLRVKNKLIN